MTLNLRAFLSGRRNVMSTTRLPVLFLTDLVVLPGMVVPIELDDAARAAVDAAKAHSDDTLLVAPRLEDRYASYGVVVEIVQLGRLATGEPALVSRGRVLRSGLRLRNSPSPPTRPMKSPSSLLNTRVSSLRPCSVATPGRSLTRSIGSPILPRWPIWQATRHG